MRAENLIGREFSRSSLPDRTKPDNALRNIACGVLLVTGSIAIDPVLRSCNNLPGIKQEAIFKDVTQIPGMNMTGNPAKDFDYHATNPQNGNQ